MEKKKTSWLVPGRAAVFLVLYTIRSKIIVMKKIDKHKGAQSQSGIIDEDKLRSIQNPFHQAHYGGYTMGMDFTNLIFGLMMFLIGYDYTNPGIIAGFVFSGIFLLVAILSFFLLRNTEKKYRVFRKRRFFYLFYSTYFFFGLLFATAGLFKTTIGESPLLKGVYVEPVYLVAAFAAFYVLLKIWWYRMAMKYFRRYPSRIKKLALFKPLPPSHAGEIIGFVLRYLLFDRPYRFSLYTGFYYNNLDL